VVFALLYLVLRRLFRWAAGSADSVSIDQSKDVEILVLRHQLKVLRRQAMRPKLRRIDRVLWPPRTVRIQRSAKAFARGDRTGVMMISVPSEENTRSKLAVYLASRSRRRKRNDWPSSARSNERFLPCWATHAESGFLVTPARRTRRLPTSMANSTYSVRRRRVSVVKKSNARTPLAWARRNSDHVGPERRGAGPRPWRRSNTRIFWRKP